VWDVKSHRFLFLSLFLGGIAASKVTAMDGQCCQIQQRAITAS
jgi:hypothetical protein